MRSFFDREYHRVYLQDMLERLNRSKERLEAEITDEDGEFIYDAKPSIELRLLRIYREISDLQSELDRL